LIVMGLDPCRSLLPSRVATAFANCSYRQSTPTLLLVLIAYTCWLFHPSPRFFSHSATSLKHPATFLCSCSIQSTYVYHHQAEQICTKSTNQSANRASASFAPSRCSWPCIFHPLRQSFKVREVGSLAVIGSARPQILHASVTVRVHWWNSTSQVEVKPMDS
jgi:hypothetical protein